MDAKTRKLFNAMMTGMVTLYGSGSSWNGQDKFSINPISPELEQKLENRIQEKSGLLRKVNIVGVRDTKAEKLGLLAGNSIASRTDTEQEDRKTQYIGDMDGRDYELYKTDFDTHITYPIIDTWSSQPNFQTLYRDKVVEQIARDRVKIGWHGTHVAKTTSRNDYPMLEDVNRGWLQAIRQDKPENFIGADGGTKVKIGEGGDFKTLDSAIFDARGSLLDPWYRQDTNLVLIVGYELWHKHNLTLLEENDVATERNALDAWFAKEKIAGLRVVLEPFFPERAALITSYKNLSIYWQKGSRRRTIEDNAKRDRIEDYQSVNEGYVVEDYGMVAGYDSTTILLPDGQGGWA